jgi:hypothetical protein
MNGHFGGGCHAELHPVAVNGQNRDGHSVADGNHLSTLAAQNQHDEILLVKNLSPFTFSAGGAGSPALTPAFLPTVAGIIREDTISRKRIKGNTSQLKG